MRRFFLFAVFWAALFGSGHVLAACPMDSARHDVTQSPCHGEPEHGTVESHGGDCCAWVAPSTTATKACVQKGDAPDDELNAAGFTAVARAFGVVQRLTHPPPLSSLFPSLHAGLSGSDTYLRTARLRL